MRIIRIMRQHRRDFTAIYKCEHCGHEVEANGYDDAHFHNNVVPGMICSECKKTASDDYRPLTTKHPEGMQV